MASGNAYGAYSDGFSRAHIKWTTTETATTVKITIVCGQQFKNGVAKGSSFDFWGSLSGSLGSQTYTKTDRTIGNEYGAGWTFGMIEVSKTFTKTTSAQTATVTFYGSASYVGDTSSKAVASITIPALASYNVTYNANGGSGAPATQKKYYGKTLTLSSTKPTRTGYSFVRWNTNTSNSGTAYNPGASYTGNAALTLYAIWKANTYTVTYDANGGSGAPAAQTKTYGVNLTLSSTQPKKIGYTFVRWNTNTANTGTAYSPGGTYTTNSALKLYAIWRINTYTVTYNANGGTGAPANQTKTYGVNLTLSSTVPTRTGYTFVRWNTNTANTGAYYSPGGTYAGEDNMTLYAIWQADTYPVTYNANGGVNAPENQTKTYGTTLTLSTEQPTREGYTFQSWNTASDGSGATYAPGAFYTGNTALSLNAIWEINTFTISYNANGGSGAPIDQIKTYGININLSDITPTKLDYAFKTWNTASDGTGTNYSPSQVYAIDASLALTAIWESTYTPPRIDNLTAYRVNGLGDEAEDGTYARVNFNVVNGTGAEGAVTASSIKIGYKESHQDTYVYTTVEDPTPLALSCVIGNGDLDAGNQYDIVVVLTPTGTGRVDITRATYISISSFVIDINADGTAVAIGKQADDNFSGFVMGFDPYIVLDTLAEPGTKDQRLYAAIQALGWENDILILDD